MMTTILITLIAIWAAGFLLVLLGIAASESESFGEPGLRRFMTLLSMAIIWPLVLGHMILKALWGARQ